MLVLARPGTAWQYHHLSLVPQAELSHQLQLLVKSGLLERSPGSCISLPIVLGNLPVDHAVTLTLSQALKTNSSVSSNLNLNLCSGDCSVVESVEALRAAEHQNDFHLLRQSRVEMARCQQSFLYPVKVVPGDILV